MQPNRETLRQLEGKIRKSFCLLGTLSIRIVLNLGRQREEKKKEKQM